jgi:sulfide:quinone oxidoreductase
MTRPGRARLLWLGSVLGSALWGEGHDQPRAHSRAGGRLWRARAGHDRVRRAGHGTGLPYDLFLGVPRHKVPAVVEDSGLTADGWVPVDPLTLETAFPGVYAVGDVTSVGTPKAGVFAEGQASVVASRIISVMGGTTGAATYDGRGPCYLEFGHQSVARVDVTFVSGQAPVGDFESPSEQLAADKVRFGTDRIRRWFDE